MLERTPNAAADLSGCTLYETLCVISVLRVYDRTEEVSVLMRAGNRNFELEKSENFSDFTNAEIYRSVKPREKLHNNVEKNV